MTLSRSQSPEGPQVFDRISDYVGHYASVTPEAEALVLDNKCLSYRDLHEQTERLAAALLGAGVKPGDRVATLCTPSPDYFVCFLATGSIGAIWVGLNPRYQMEELSYVMEDSQPVILLARSVIDARNYSNALTTLKVNHRSIRQVVILDEEAGLIPEGATGLSEFLMTANPVASPQLEAARRQAGGRNPCMIVYTSGSTGRPKGALLHHEGMIAVSLAQNRAWPLNPMRTLNYFPINHVGCVVDLSCPTLVAGGTTVFLENFSPAASLELMQREKITLWGSVPSVFQLQLADPTFGETDLSEVQLIVWEGAAIPADLLARLLEHGAPLATNYGMTESCGAITCVPPTRDQPVLSGCVGWPIEGVEVRLADGADLIDGDGVTGEVQCRSIYNMLGYWHRPEATREALSEDGWLSTGDLAQRNADGSYTIVGRSKEMYKSGGYNVYPREVEMVIESHPNVEMSAVVSVSDPVWQEIGIAYVLTTGVVPVDELMSWCRSRLANYKLPKRFVFVDQLPLLPIGKVDKVLLKKRAAEEMKAASAP